jgi:drug/metabolite transporter (DMT)-like permease
LPHSTGASISGKEYSLGIDGDSNNKSKWLARTMVFACAILYGSNYACTVILQQSLPPSIAAALRFLLASICFLPHVLSFRGNYRAILGGVEIGLWSSVGYISQALSLQHTSASKTAFFSGLGVLFVPLLDFLFRRNKSQNNSKDSHFMAPLLAFCGVAFLEWGGMEAPKIDDIFLAVTPMAFALAFWRVEQLSRRFPEDTPVIVGSLLIAVTLISSVWCYFSGTLPTSIASACGLVKLLFSDIQMIGGLLHTSLLATAFTSYIEQNAMKYISAAETTLIYTFEPLSACAFASLLLNERLGYSTLIGALFIIAATMRSTLGPLNLSGIVVTFGLIFNRLLSKLASFLNLQEAYKILKMKSS